MRASALALALALLSPAAAHAAQGPPPPLSADATRAPLRSAHGSGSFGTWRTDALGLPVYRYRIDHTTDPRARQTELAGSRLAWHQVGNDNLVANAYNEGHVQLWSQARLAQWVNRRQPADRHWGGGFGWLRAGDEVVSTLWPDRPAGAPFVRDFGVGYVRKRVRAHGLDVTQVVVAPFGDDPLLVDEVTIRNTTRRTRAVSWFEYWAVNPFNQYSEHHRTIALRRPEWDPATRTITVAQETSADGDRRPHAIFAAALSGPVEGFETSVRAFFGDGDRARPAAVVADRLSGSIAPPRAAGEAGDTLAVFRSPLRLRPGEAVTLRYAYGIAPAADIPALVAKYRAQRSTHRTSGRAWARWLPRADFGPGRRWVARELAWDAYLLRSATQWEEACGHHTITQGGYYQYVSGQNMAYRNWIHYPLPLVYAEPELAREVLRYSLRLQPPPPAPQQQSPYGVNPLCARMDLGSSGDLDFWLLLTAAEYGLGSRDLAFFDERIPYWGTRKAATVWRHLKDAFAHQESLYGLNGGYYIGVLGDWTDFTPLTVLISESLLLTAQLAYAYEKLAELADLRGDGDFARRLRAAARRNRATLRREWTARGWYPRGFRGPLRVGTGVIFSEVQSWAILAGAPAPDQARRLVRNIRRFLTGHGAPGGPSPIGSAESPAADDPGVTETTPLQPLLDLLPPSLLERIPQLGGPMAQRSQSAAWPGNVWYDLNGHLTWALASLDGTVEGARELAWDEYTRNTLARRSEAWPDHWAGTISVDDVCNAWYARDPKRCGGFSSEYDGQVTEQPVWMVMNALRLAGVTPTRDGYRIAPALPFSRFALRLPRIGVARERGRLRGYVRPEAGGPVAVEVRLPAGVEAARVTAWADGRRVAHRTGDGTVTVELDARAGRAADWAVTW